MDALEAYSTLLKYVFQTKEEMNKLISSVCTAEVMAAMKIPTQNTNLSPEQFAKYKKATDLHAAEKSRLATLELESTPLPRKEGEGKKCRVFTRVRPLNEAEEKEGGSVIKGLVTKTNLGTDAERVKGFEGEQDVDGFNGVFGIDATNADVYKATLGAALDVTLDGGSTSAFCYGHTGTGKTHTSLGYDKEPGLFKLACADLLEKIDEINKTPQEGGKLQLSVRFTEVYLDKIYDLLNDREQSRLQEDKNGNVCIRQKVKKRKIGDLEIHFAADQKFVVIKDVDHLLEVLKDGIALRACGSSSIHDQSSRSHALLEMEIVNDALLKVRQECLETLALETAAHHRIQDALQMITEKGDQGLCFQVPLAERKLEKDESGTIVTIPPHTYLLCDPNQYTGGETITVDEWCKRADAFFADFHKAVPIAEKATRARIAKEKEMVEVLKKSPQIVGGRLVLVDLAGADHDNRDLTQTSKKELKESADINKQLFVLKNCMCKMGVENERIPWRDTKLTMVLKCLLRPPEGGACQPVMIATVSPADSQEKSTMNTIRYGQMVTGFKPKKKARTRPRDEAAVKEIYEIYKEHAPEKTKADIEKILKKFAGREKVLVMKMRKKYVMAKAKKPQVQEPTKGGEAEASTQGCLPCAP